MLLELAVPPLPPVPVKLTVTVPAPPDEPVIDAAVCVTAPPLPALALTLVPPLPPVAAALVSDTFPEALWRYPWPSRCHHYRRCLTPRIGGTSRAPLACKISIVA